MKDIPPILQIGEILISSDLLTEQFCCDLAVCKGQCCIEGDAGAPVTTEEVMQIEESLDECWSSLSASAQTVIDRQGVAYTDEEGDLVTSIVNGKDCVFTYYDDIDDSPVSDSQPEGSPVSDSQPEDSQSNDTQSRRLIRQCCLCALEKAYRAGRITFCKPISCALYPIREKRFSDGTIALNYHRWAVCKAAVAKGRELQMPVYKFLEGPLVRRFGQEWYNELCQVAEQLASL